VSSLAGQTAVVTGATSGIGKSIARALVRQEVEVHLVGRSAEKAERVAGELRADVPDARVRVCLMDFSTDIREAAARLAEDAAVDILVHSAGSILLKPFEATTDDEFDAQLRINARSPFILTRALLPCLRNRQGQVVFINSSASQQKARSHQSAYAASKFALTAIADSLRDEVNDAGVRVLSVFPGRTATPMQESVFEFEQREYCGERLLQPEDVAESVVSALSLPRTAEVTDLHLRPFRRH
jgi:NAD(P)-dependent dehydrogenase (short-subunit alcohol dehydrogenase family)